MPLHIFGILNCRACQHAVRFRQWQKSRLEVRLCGRVVLLNSHKQSQHNASILLLIAILLLLLLLCPDSE